MAGQPKLKVSVNKNPTKEGIKIQFVLPQTLMGDEKAAMTQKLQAKLNQGLAQHNLTSNIDTDVPYSNVIGFLIRIQDIRLMVIDSLKNIQNPPPTPPTTPNV